MTVQKIETIQIKLKDAFLLNSQTTVLGHKKPSVNTPPVKSEYEMPLGLLTDLIYWHSEPNGVPLFLAGPTGCGKTSGVEQFFARLNYPVYSITAHARMELADLVGMWTMGEGGKMQFIYGPLALAMMFGGVCIINEMDILDPAVLAGFNGLRDGAPLIIPENGGQTITPHEAFRLVMTGNSNGTGDEDGLYQGVMTQSAAFMNGLLTLEVDYLPSEKEVALLKRVVKDPCMSEEVLERMVAFAGDIRDAFSGKKMERVRTTLSTRNLLTWARWTERCKGITPFSGKTPLFYALERVLLNKASSGDRGKIEETFRVHFGSDETSSSEDD